MRRALGNTPRQAAILLGCGVMALSGSSLAQEEPPPVPAEEAPPAEVPPAEAPTPEPAAVAPAEPDDTEALAAQAAEIAELKAAVEELKAKQEEAEMAALLSDEDVSVEEDLFKVYGFMDMGLQKTWVNKDALVAALFDTNALTFATGNINLYFDANPHPDWRGLAEVRFTSAPLGNVNTFGGITGDQFSRTDTEQYDPHATVINAPMWGGYTVIERAWIEWKKFQQVRVRVGNFFTPFGIWNVDHGSPTLISISMPQFIQQKFIPLRQTGVQLNGSFFMGEWEMAYRAWVTNGRTEKNVLDFDDDKGYGGRLFFRRDGGKVRAQFGGSFHHDNVENKVIDIVQIPGFPDPDIQEVQFNNYSTVAYSETIVGADVSLDIGDTRIRSEYIGQLRQYKDGKNPDNGVTSAIPGTRAPSGWRQAAYVLVAQQLPWWGLEPYLYSEVIRQDWDIPGDAIVTYSAGLNIRFNPAAMFKLQASRAQFFRWLQDKDFPGDPSKNNVSTITSRIVLAF